MQYYDKEMKITNVQLNKDNTYGIQFETNGKEYNMNYTNTMPNTDGIKFFTKEKKYGKDKKAFEAEEGVCYVDMNGKTYTYEDLCKIAGSEDAAKKLFANLDETIEKSFENCWYFSKCRRCGKWIYNSEFRLLKKNDVVCPYCRPIRTNGIIEVERNPYEDDRKFYTKRKVTFVPGVTTLVGCNGIGKTTLLQNIESQLKGKDVPVFLFDNMSSDGGGNAGINMFGRMFSGMEKDEGDSIELAATLYASSEGECIQNAILRFAKKLLKRFEKFDGFGEYWILFDAIDSGLSLDVMEFLKMYLFNILISKLPSESNVYIISSSNSYELSEGTQTFSVAKMKYVNIKSYNAYKKIIHDSLAYKKKRDHVLEVKYQIWNRDYVWKTNEKSIEKLQNRKTVHDNKAAELILDDYKMTMSVQNDSDSCRIEYHLFKRIDGKYQEVKPKDFYPETWDIYEDKIKKTMHDCVCNCLFRDWKKKEKTKETTETK